MSINKELVKSTRYIYDCAHKGKLKSFVWVEMHEDGSVAHGFNLDPMCDSEKLSEAIVSLLDDLSGTETEEVVQ